ncbi:MAG: amino acid adenylation domain-containing protein [Gammaproteobacteria bacterium]|nr:amino acid adenylation domain-containing protein [Gammaproteobacteria bacterium]
MTSANPLAGVALTPAQTLMWIEGRLHPEVPVNNMVTRLDIRQRLDVGAFKQAFARLVDAHDAMRMVVSNSSGNFVATIAGGAQPELPFVDFSGDAAEQDFAAWIQRKCRQVFGLDEQLHEAALVRLDEQHFVFFLNQHHCMTDGRSCQVMIADLDRFYREATGSGGGDESGQAAPHRSFGEYLVLRADYLRSEQARASEAYWNARFERAPEPVRFYGHGSDRKRASMRRHTRVLPLELSQKILNVKRDTPPSIVFATALFAFLKRVTGNSDLCIGVPLLNRAPEFADTLGMFMEISRNRLNVGSEDNLSALLGKIRAEANDIKPHRSHTVTSRNGRFECMLNYRVPSDTRFGGAAASLQRIAAIALLDSVPGEESSAAGDWAGRTSLDVDITHTPASGEFCLAMDFNIGVWPDAAARERSLDHFIRLLEHFFDNRTVLVDSLELPGEAELRLLRSWNDTGRVYPSHTGIQQLFEAQVERTPAAIALEFCDQRLSYRELDCRANRLAHALVRHGVQPDQPVGVCLNRSPELVVALLAVLKAGAGYVPLDPALPRQRHDLIVEEAGLELIITERTLPELLRAGDFTDSNPRLALASSRLAYVIFTSGSTGRPKGVMIEHAALVNFIHAAQQVLQLREHHRLLSVTTASFDIFALELFAPLVCGARMVLANDETVVDGRLLARQINDRGVTHLQATPATWHLLLDAGWQPAQALVGVVGGELLTGSLGERLAARCVLFMNWYGPTETTVYASHAVVRAGHYRAGDIGRPLANYRIHVLDAWLKPLPIGVAGEICIGGDCLARGYLGRDELTAAAFVEAGEFGRLYRSGDLGRWTSEGHIEYLGRSDFQVKVRGYRIELGEIEASLLSHPLVEEAVVAVIGDAQNKQLAAYVRLAPDSDRAAQPGALLREHLKQSLPKYMIPATVSVLERMPLTPSGKVDRKALPAPFPDAGLAAESCVAPQTPMQEIIAGIWAEVLGLERVGIRDDFFDLGGHSLAAMSVVTRIEEALGIRLDLADFFQGLTVEDICATAGEACPVEAIAVGASGAALSPLYAIGRGPGGAAAARSIHSGQPLYRLDVHALQGERLDKGLQPLRDVEEMACRLVDIILAAQRRGPYRIAGECDGAVVGFAVAVELQRRGKQVTQLILCDAPAPGQARGAGSGAALFARLGRQFKALHRDLGMAGRLREIIRNQHIEYAVSRALDCYGPSERFDGSIILARSAGAADTRDGERAMDWARYASMGVQVHDLTGDPGRWLREHAELPADATASMAPAARVIRSR